jgi:hypothetical protein
MYTVDAVVAGRQDVRQAGQVADLRHRLVFVRELEHVEIRIGHHDVFGLPADPTAHIHIPVRAAGTGRVHVEADARLLLAAVPTPSTSDVEWHRYQVADLDELHV